jgi:hypothetical protein
MGTGVLYKRAKVLHPGYQPVAPGRLLAIYSANIAHIAEVKQEMVELPL